MAQWIILAAVPLFVLAGCGGVTRSFLNSPWRARWQQPERVMHTLAIQPGAQVARPAATNAAPAIKTALATVRSIRYPSRFWFEVSRGEC